MVSMKNLKKNTKNFIRLNFHADLNDLCCFKNKTIIIQVNCIVESCIHIPLSFEITFLTIIAEYNSFLNRNSRPKAGCFNEILLLDAVFQQVYDIYILDNQPLRYQLFAASSEYQVVPPMARNQKCHRSG